jgi:hypothetical protein
MADDQFPLEFIRSMQSALHAQVGAARQNSEAALKSAADVGVTVEELGQTLAELINAQGLESYKAYCYYAINHDLLRVLAIFISAPAQVPLFVEVLKDLFDLQLATGDLIQLATTDQSISDALVGYNKIIVDIRTKVVYNLEHPA